jgi:hypothetical protein
MTSPESPRPKPPARYFAIVGFTAGVLTVVLFLLILRR